MARTRNCGRLWSVKELLGHANIATADTYLNAGRIHLHESMLRLEAEGKVRTKPFITAKTWPASRAPRCLNRC